jgi:hypothetical protein
MLAQQCLEHMIHESVMRDEQLSPANQSDANILNAMYDGLDTFGGSTALK